MNARPLVVLWQAGEISGPVHAKLASLGARVIGPADYQVGETLTHVVVAGHQDYAAITAAFGGAATDIQLVSLTPVSDQEAFVRANGRLVVDPAWAEGPMGAVVLEKFFLGQASVHLEEAFPAVRERGGFKVTNHLRTGHDMDRMALFAHEKGQDLVNLRTFVDHALYFFSYLRQAGVGFTPFEVDYTHTGGELVVQLHLPVRGFQGEHALGSFGPPNPHDPAQYLLGVCARSTDFMELHHVASAGRLVLSGQWRAGGSVGFPGFLLNHVDTAAQVRRALETHLKAPLPLNRATEVSRSEDAGAKPLPGALFSALLPEASSGYLKPRPALAQRMVVFLVSAWLERHPGESASNMTAEELRESLGGFPDPQEVARLVDEDYAYLRDCLGAGGVAEACEEEITRVRGAGQDDDFKRVLQETLVEEVAARVAGGIDEDEFSQLVKGGGAESAGKQVVGGGEEKEDDFVARFGAGAKTGPQSNWRVNSLGTALAESLGARGLDLNLITPEQRDELLRDSMRTVLKATPAVEEEDLVRVVAEATGKDVAQAAAVVKAAREKTQADMVLKRLAGGDAPVPAAYGDGNIPPALFARLQKLEADLQRSKALLEASQVELRAHRDAQTQLAQVGQRIAQAVQTAPDAAALERAGAEERELRKLKLEAQQKDILFTQELEKNQRALKSRDLVVEKAKESLRLTVEKKDKQIQELNARLTAALALQNNVQQVYQQMKALEQEKQSLARLNEVYKAKLASVSALVEKQASAGGGKKDEELRKLSVDKQRAELQAQALSKELAKVKGRLDTDQAEVKRLHAENAKLQEKIRAGAAAATAAVSIKSSAVEESQSQRIKELERDLQAQTQKAMKSDQNVKDLEQKVAELTGMLAKGGSSSGDQALKSKATQLEGSIKKLTQDLAAANNQVGEFKKEVQKLRSEKTALQNQIDKAKKEAEKAKPKKAA